MDLNWFYWALVSAVFLALVTVFAKVGLKGADTGAANLVRTVVITAALALLLAYTGKWGHVGALSVRNWLFLVLSGLATCISWTAYFKALQLGETAKSATIEKFSIVLVALMSIAFLKERPDALEWTGIGLISCGVLMLAFGRTRPLAGGGADTEVLSRKWLLWALAASFFLALTTIFAKLGLHGIDSDFATFVRTVVIIAVLAVFSAFTGKWRKIGRFTKKNWLFLVLSGLATGVSWLAFFKALQMGEAAKVNTVGKFSVVLVAVLSVLFLKEKPRKQEWGGIAVITAGVAVLALRHG